jgi:hypothetical protein
MYNMEKLSASYETRITRTEYLYFLLIFTERLAKPINAFTIENETPSTKSASPCSELQYLLW